MRAPLTRTFFAVELTGNSHILLPLLAASVAASRVTVLLMKRSILTERIARRGHHISREYAIDPFLQTRVEKSWRSPSTPCRPRCPSPRRWPTSRRRRAAPAQELSGRRREAVISSAWCRAPTSCAGPATAWTTASRWATCPRAMSCCRHARRTGRRSRRPHGGRGHRPRAGLGARQRQGRRPGGASRSLRVRALAIARRAGARPRAACAGRPRRLDTCSTCTRRACVPLRCRCAASSLRHAARHVARLSYRDGSCATVSAGPLEHQCDLSQSRAARCAVAISFSDIWSAISRAQPHGVGIALGRGQIEPFVRRDEIDRNLAADRIHHAEREQDVAGGRPLAERRRGAVEYFKTCHGAFPCPDTSALSRPPAPLPPADAAIMFRTFEWWFKQCDELKLNFARDDAAKSATHR